MPDAAAAGPALKPYVLVYDGECRVCTRIAGRIREMDRDAMIDVVPFAESRAETRFPWIPAEAFADAMQLVGPGNETWQGAAAVEKLFDLLPRARWLRWVFALPFGRLLADRFYRWFGRNRYRFGCSDHCRP